MLKVRSRINFVAVYTIIFEITFILWLNAKPSNEFLFGYPFLSLTQLSGLLAVSLVSFNLLLASRLRFFENLFGGLDKVYKEHQLTGKIAFSLMLAHPVFFAISNIDSPRILQLYFLSFDLVAANWGKAALFGFTILIILSIFVKLPYHIWKITHKLMILPIIFTAVHVSQLSSDIIIYPPLRYWVVGSLYLAMALYIYKVVLYGLIGPKVKYKIDSVKPLGKITEIWLSPLGKRLNFEPGQFVFTRFESKGVSTEEHPFSISSSPVNQRIRFSIKNSGDFTSTLSMLKPGETIKLYGPYGLFGKEALSTKKDILFIAGGIGITPFLSVLNYIKDRNIDKNFNIIYTYKNESESNYKEELSMLVGDRLITHNSDKNGHLSAKIISERLGDVNKKLILLCGPRRMMFDLSKQFRQMGVSKRNIIFEDFALKD